MSSKILKIGQISDIHIGNGNELVQGIDVCANFRKALNSDSMQGLDLLVLSGDLSENSDPGAYEYVASLLKDYKSPYCIITGNHDDINVMRQYFDLESVIHGDRCYYRYDLEGRTIFFLDSACGNVSPEQLTWLQEEASKIKGEVILFMHHPPCFCGHRFMDLRYHLENMVEVQQVLAGIKNLTHIYAGHYHHHFEVNMGRQIVHVAPATQFQIDPNVPYFNLKSAAPGWQLIEWGEKFVETEVYFE
jgi:Icc protein